MYDNISSKFNFQIGRWCFFFLEKNKQKTVSSL